MQVGIVGYGHVGGAMKNLFSDAIVYDKYKNIGSKEEINRCDAIFICVPTPQAEDGSCDTAAVDEVLSWARAEITLIRSTVPVGYTRMKVQQLQRDIVFQPEYYGETTDHPFADLQNRRWLVFGGTAAAVSKAIQVYHSVYNADIQICIVNSDTAELAKYMENAFLALKVVFCNEFYDIAQKFNVSYDDLREAWTMDPRIGRSHTFVFNEARGFGGACLPKDVSAIRMQAIGEQVNTIILDAIEEKNKLYAAKNAEKQDEPIQ